MWRSKTILVVVFGVLFFAGLTRVYAASVVSDTKTRSVSGEIVWIDANLGKMHLQSDAGQDTIGTAEYNINQNETRVTDPSDKKFLAIKDLLAGQHVTIELIDSPEETMVRKIIAEPMAEPVFKQATGELEAIDVQAGTFIIEEEPLSGGRGRGNLSYFVFEPRDIIVMRSPSTQPVQLKIMPGDLVNVAYVVKDGRRHARSITLLSAVPETTSTTTVTTKSTTVTR